MRIACRTNTFYQVKSTPALASRRGAYFPKIAPRWALKSSTWLRPPGGVDLAKKSYRTGPHSGTKSSSKRNESCIAFSGSIPEQLLHSEIDLLKIRPIVRWYSPVEAHQRCIYTANRKTIQNSYAICLIFILPSNFISK